MSDRFEIERIAGAGGMGEVYRARDLTTGGAVALKVLRLKLGDGLSPGDLSRFLREPKILAELQHPGIVRYITHGEMSSGEPYLVMEWLEGESLSARLSRGPLGVAASIELVRRVADALAAAHARGVVHRDLKPANLLLVGGRIEGVKVLDFGLARLEGLSQTVTQAGLAVGTLGYMAPEQALGERGLDARADVFSLGCVLFACLTGRAPFWSERAGAVLLKILHDEPPRVRQIRPEVPAALDDLLARMLHKSRAERPADGAAVAAALASLERCRDAPSVPPQARMLTRAEQRLVCFVVAGPRRSLLVESLGASVVARAMTDVTHLIATAEQHGGHVEFVADGSTLITLSGVGPATDLAAQAARCALALHRILPETPVAVAMGRGDNASGRPMSEAIDRVAGLLGPSGAQGDVAPDPDDFPVRIDEVSAGLLDARFEVRGDRRSLVLVRERAILERPRTLLGKPTPFVGREREMAMLEALFDECTADSVARAALVISPPGGGKSRLRYELLRVLVERVPSIQVWFGRGSPMAAGAPLGILGSLIRGVAHFSDDDPPEALQHKLRARVGRSLRGEETGRVAAFLGEFTGVPFPADDLPALAAARRDPALMSDHVQRAWEAFAAAECAAQPVLLVLEDLHWADPASFKLVDGLLRRLKSRRLMVLALARPSIHEIAPRLWADRGAQSIRLGELSPRACARLVRAVLGDAPTEAEVDMLVERSGGSPFFLEELIRAHASGGALPDTVLAMVQERLERIDPETRRVLRAASVFGLGFSAEALGALVGDEVLGLDARIDDLEEAEVLERRGDPWGGDEEIAFRQAIVREAAYAMLTESDRRLGHRLAGEWLERGGKTDAAVLARHFSLGGDLDRAARYHLAAAEAALLASSPEGALAHAAQGVACGPSGETLGGLISVQMQAHATRGEVTLARQIGEGVLALLPRGGLRACRASASLALLAVQLGDGDLLEDIAHDFTTVEPVEEARAATAVTASSLAVSFARLGLQALAVAQLRRAEELAGPSPDDPGVMAWLALARSLHAAIHETDPYGQLTATRTAMTELERVGDRFTAGFATVQHGGALIALGRYADAERLLGGALASASAMGLGLIITGARLYLPIALAHRGALDQAREVASTVLATSIKAQNPHTIRMAHLALARVHLLAADLDAAAREASEVALARPSAPGEPMTAPLLQAEGNALLAAIELRRRRPAEALAAADRAFAWRASHGEVGHVDALLHLSRAEALDALGRVEEARTALATALDRLLARAARIDDPALRQSFLSAVPENARTLSLATTWGL
ncbi:MAG: protein kinase [Byssovorax sp.]